LGGYQLAIKNKKKANSTINYYVFNNVKGYDVCTLPRKERQAVSKSMKYLEIKRENNFIEFVEKSYPVYHSFYCRSQYKYRRDRINYNVYSKWAGKLFNSEKTIILGVYRKDVMIGVLTMAYVRGVIAMLTQFSHTDYLKFNPSDLLFHTVRVIASKCEGIQFIYSGMMSADKGINDFKETRGASLIKAPSCYYVNPIASIMLKCLAGKYLRKITGEM
jgi:hypothetical protein